LTVSEKPTVQENASPAVGSDLWQLDDDVDHAAGDRLAAAELLRKADALIRRRITALPIEAQGWRESVTAFNVDAALSRFAEIQSMMFKIADAYGTHGAGGRATLSCLSEAPSPA
jgi:hypothetical protein